VNRACVAIARQRSRHAGGQRAGRTITAREGATVPQHFREEPMRPSLHLQARSQAGTPAPGARPAFTLVELLIVVSIIALLIALLLPALGGVRQSARRAATETLMREVLTATTAFQAANNRMPGYFSAIDMASGENITGANARGMTMMENILLDLAGGVVDADNAPNPSADQQLHPRRPLLG
jgi:prepilin-type N-terminal cleavage/methylation domain-containing protein